MTILDSRCKDARMKYGFAMSLLVFCLIVSFNNENAGSLNPILFYPMCIISLDFRIEYFILMIIIPLLGGLIGTYTALNTFKIYLTNEEVEQDIQVELEIIKAKNIKFEL